MEANGSAESFGIDRMCFVFLTEEAWRLLGLEKREQAVVCSVEREDVQFFTTVGVIQVPRTRARMIERVVSPYGTSA